MIYYLLDIVRSFRIADFFDIVVISVLTYTVLTWFKKTASRFVVIGIGILGFIYVLARSFHLYLTVLVFQGFFAILLIAMVVIFQEDLRRFFERVAMWGVVRKRTFAPSPHQDADILSKAVANLVRKRYGALIVLKGSDHLDRHLQGGVPLDGKLSEALLDSIFDPHSLGHDGAAIIEDGRVARFACRLPLSSNTKAIGHLGLRHTAALGLGERSDALCIVVSEERGAISVVRDGELKPLDTADELKARIEAFYKEQSPASVRKTWRHWARENPQGKAIAVLVACGLWLAFGYQTASLRRDFLVPIEYRNLASDWMIEEPDPRQATVTLTGSEQAFNLVDPRALIVSLDMSKLKEGKQEIVLQRDRVQHSSNLSVVAIEPSTIEITAHHMIPIDAPIRVRTSGRLPRGLTLKQIFATPASIQVLALPKNGRRSEIVTEPINLGSIKNTSILTPRLVLPPHMRFVDNKLPDVQVTVKVERRPS